MESSRRNNYGDSDCDQNDDLERDESLDRGGADAFFGFETISLLHRLPCINSLALWLALAPF